MLYYAVEHNSAHMVVAAYGGLHAWIASRNCAHAEHIYYYFLYSFAWRNRMIEMDDMVDNVTSV